MTALRLYTDGSCAAPGAVGGWAWILVREHAVASGSGATPGWSTHNAAELTAAIEGLAYLVASGVREVELFSDSRYLVGGMSFNGRTGWAHAAPRYAPPADTPRCTISVAGPSSPARAGPRTADISQASSREQRRPGFRRFSSQTTGDRKVVWRGAA
jgi:RNase H